MKFLDRLIRCFFRHAEIFVASGAIMTQVCMIGWVFYKFTNPIRPVTDFWGIMSFSPISGLIGLLVFGGAYRIALVVAERKMAQAFKVNVAKVHFTCWYDDQDFVHNFLMSRARVVQKQLSILENDLVSTASVREIRERKREIKEALFWKPYRYAFRLGFGLKHGISDYLESK